MNLKANGEPLAYHRFPGPGDLPHPNDPQNEPEEIFGWDEAAGDVACRMEDDGEVGELVETLANAAEVLGWLSREVTIPPARLTAFRELLKLAERVHDEVESQYQTLNTFEPDDFYEAGE